MTRRPLSGSVLVSGDAASHAVYKVAPATDYAVRTGTPLYAPFSGSISRYWSITGGNTVRLDNNPNLAFVGQHLSGYAGGTRVSEGDLIGYTGNTGSATTGPHLHCWVERNGVRITFEKYCGDLGGTETPIWRMTPDGSQPAGGNVTPIPIITRKAPPMFAIFRMPDNGVVYIQGVDGRREGVQSMDHLEALFKYRAAMNSVGSEVDDIYFGDFVGNRGAIDWYIARVNGPRASAPPVTGKAVSISEQDYVNLAKKVNDERDARELKRLNSSK